MSNRIDYEKARRKRQRKSRLRQIASIAAMGLLVLVAVFVNDYLVKQNITTQVGEIVGSMGGSGFPVRAPGGNIRYTGGLGKNLMLMNENNLYVYNPKGKQLLNIQQINERSIVKSNDSQILTYNEGGKRFSVYSSAAELYTQETPEGILLGNIGKSGDIVIVTASRQLLTEINVYSSSFEWKMKKSDTKYQVGAVAISPKGSTLAVGYVTTVQGKLRTVIIFYDTVTGEETEPIILDDQLVLMVDFLSETRLSILTDRTYSVFSTQGINEGTYKYPAESTLRGFEFLESTMVLFYSNDRTHKIEYVSLGDKAQLNGIFSSEEKVNDIVVTKRHIYFLLPTGIERHTLDMKLQELVELDDILRIEYVGDRMYLITSSEVSVWEDKQ